MNANFGISYQLIENSIKFELNYNLFNLPLDLCGTSAEAISTSIKPNLATITHSPLLQTFSIKIEMKKVLLNAL